jgi:hypothetical protein
VTTTRWVKTSGAEADFNATVDMRMASDEESHVHKSLLNYCGWLVEEYDDSITSGLMNGAITDELTVQEYICSNMTAHCPDGSPAIEFVDDGPPPGTPEPIKEGPEANQVAATETTESEKKWSDEL